MPSYITDLRRIVGSRPLVACGSCVILVNEENEVLLQQRTDDNTWGLPGGTMDIGESLEETARREVNEEVGLRCGHLELMDVFSGPALFHRYPNGDELYNVTTAYICNSYSGTPSADQSEVRDARFFALSELPSEISQPDRVVLDAYTRRLGRSSAAPSDSR